MEDQYTRRLIRQLNLGLPAESATDCQGHMEKKVLIHVDKIDRAGAGKGAACLLRLHFNVRQGGLTSSPCPSCYYQPVVTISARVSGCPSTGHRSSRSLHKAPWKAHRLEKTRATYSETGSSLGFAAYLNE